MTCFLFLSYLVSPTNDTQLFPYGGDAGDLQGPLGDDSSSPPLILTTPFMFFGKQYMEIIVKPYIYLPIISLTK